VSVSVVVNGEERELQTGATVADLVAALPGAPDGRGVAVAVDGLVVRRRDWSSTALAAGARIEIVVAVQGG
jgi:sulfur carrier protein